MLREGHWLAPLLSEEMIETANARFKLEFYKEINSTQKLLTFQEFYPAYLLQTTRYEL